MVACFGLNEGYQLPRFRPDRLVENLLRLDIWTLLQSGALVEGVTTELRWGEKGCQLARRVPNLFLDGTPIAVVWDEPMAGVGRPWFECPQCGGRCRHVYLREVIACRRCYRLDYACRHRHRAIPGFGRLLYLRRKIGADPKPFTPIVPRPRTHVRYHRIADEIRALEERLVGHLGGIVNDLERRIRVRKANGTW